MKLIKPVRKEKHYFIYSCTRCKGEFATLLNELGEKCVCDLCINHRIEWICECCNQAISREIEHKSIDAAFGVCPECYENLK